MSEGLYYEIVGAEEDDVDFEEGYELFSYAGVHIYRNEELRYVAIDTDRDVIGAITLGTDSRYASFSVVVDSKFRRQGVARALCEAVIDEVEETGLELRAEIINPHMIPLLRSLGFVCEDDCGCDGAVTDEDFDEIYMYRRFK